MYVFLTSDTTQGTLDWEPEPAASLHTPTAYVKGSECRKRDPMLMLSCFCRGQVLQYTKPKFKLRLDIRLSEIALRFNSRQRSMCPFFVPLLRIDSFGTNAVTLPYLVKEVLFVCAGDGGTSGNLLNVARFAT